jgi:hypothetical protein
MVEFFLALASSFSNFSARSTVSPNPWSISDFCRDLSTTSCRRQQSLGYSRPEDFDYSRVLIHTFIYCSARCINSKLRATIVGLIRSSARSLSPSRLVCGGLGHRRRTDRLRVLDF